MIRLSIVSTLYRSEPQLEQFHRRVVAAAEQITPDFELVLVDDGSLCSTGRSGLTASLGRLMIRSTS